MNAVSPKSGWYDPERWPRVLRWLLVGPLSLIAAVIIYFIYNIINGFFSEMPSAVTSLFAVVVGAFGYVAVGRIVAPAFSKAVGYTLALGALVLMADYLGFVATRGGGNLPTWYAVLFGLVGSAGALGGAFSNVPHKLVQTSEVFGWMPNVLRWLLFMPLAVVVATLTTLATGIPLMLMHINGESTRLFNTPILVVTLIAVATAMAPLKKNLVGVTLAALIFLVGVILFVGAVDRGLVSDVVAHLTQTKSSTLMFSMSPWYQALSSLSILVGCVIGGAAAIEAETMRTETAKG